MASLESKAFSVFLTLINKKAFLRKQFEFGRFDFFQSPQPHRELRRKCTVETRTFHNRNVFTLHPKQTASGTHILYLHGGAYVQNFTKQHWTFLGMLIDATRCTITAPDYPLAPTHTYRDVFAMMVPLYKELTRSAHPSRIIVMGDSSGGGMALALAQLIAKENGPQASVLILLSPWLDITLENPAILDIDPLDPFLGIDGLKKAGASYAGDAPSDHYLLSPINGPAEGLPDVYLFAGSRDILTADARKWVSLMKQQGKAVHYYEYKDMIHVWMLLNFPESRNAREKIISIVGARDDNLSHNHPFHLNHP
jgi:acetyl esterase/lipase